jgi:hypothetical protein
MKPSIRRSRQTDRSAGVSPLQPEHGSSLPKSLTSSVSRGRKRAEARAPLARVSSVVLLLAAALAGCTVGPNYERPAVNTPGTYRRAASDTNAVTGTNSFANLGWWETFDDPQLTDYVAEALTNSWDIQIAAARVLQAEAAARVTRSQYFPTVNAGGDIATTRAAQNGAASLAPGFDPERTFGDVFVAMPAYELDLWGRIRRANEAARAQLLATVEAQHTVRQTLVAQVATACSNSILSSRSPGTHTTPAPIHSI